MGRLRDEVEALVDAWDLYEATRGFKVIDYDARRAVSGRAAAPNRCAVLDEMAHLLKRATSEIDVEVSARLVSDQAFLRARLGERTDLAGYLTATQAAVAWGWTEEYVAARGDQVVKELADRGISWGPETLQELRSLESPLDEAETIAAIRAEADSLDSAVRSFTGSEAPFDLTVDPVAEDAYWSYWLDGTGSRIRLRLNEPKLRMSRVTVRQFALHEILGHGLQYASLAHTAGQHEVAWPRQFSVHGPHQCQFEGLAQAWPLFLTPDDDALILRVRLDHYRQLVSARAHLDINSGVSVHDCFAMVRRLMPAWSDDTIGDLLTDRANDPQLRSYLWSYPAGFDWFVRLSEQRRDLARGIISETYRRPHTPQQLQAHWPDGPLVGGDPA